MTWTKDEIERARSRQLPPLLRDKGYRLVELPSGAILMESVKGLVIRGNTWAWPTQQIKGNAIDFFMTVEAKTFAETMQMLCPKPQHANGGRKRPSCRTGCDQDDDTGNDDDPEDDVSAANDTEKEAEDEGDDDNSANDA